MNKLCIRFILLISVLFGKINAQPPTVSFDPVITTGLANTVDLVNAGDGSNRFFIVQRTGTVRVYKNGVLLAQPFLSMAGLLATSGSRGLLSMAFHPDYKNNGHFYVYYISSSGNVEVARYTVSGNPDIADPASRVVLLTETKPFPNHNGGKLNFGPDGYLYFALGDGGFNEFDGQNIGDPGNRSQAGNTLLGKMVRINVTGVNSPPYYSIPPDNPYVDDVNTRSEIWARGLRNPWRWSFDRQTGDMWVADVGHDTQEELNFLQAGNTGGVNYGWRCYEGTSTYSTAPACASIGSTVAPVFSYVYNNITGGRCIIGGYVYRGPEYLDLQGYYICYDHISRNGWLIDPSNNFEATRQAGWPQSLTIFAEAENGALYAASLNGTLFKVTASGAVLPLNLLSFAVIKQDGSSLVKWVTSDEINTSHFEIEKSADGSHFVKVGVLAAGHPSGIYSYTDNNNNDNGTIYYRLKMVDADGKFTYSFSARVVIPARNNKFIYPSIISDGILNIYSDNGTGWRSVELTDALGNRVMVRQLNPNQPSYKISLPALTGGVYFVKLVGAENVLTERVVIQ